MKRKLLTTFILMNALAFASGGCNETVEPHITGNNDCAAKCDGKVAVSCKDNQESRITCTEQQKCEVNADANTASCKPKDDNSTTDPKKGDACDAGFEKRCNADKSKGWFCKDSKVDEVLCANNDCNVTSGGEVKCGSDQGNTADCSEEPAGNVIPNWDFEKWEDDAVSDWTIRKSENHNPLAIKKVTSGAKSCKTAINLSTKAKSPQALQTVEQLLFKPGEYRCNVWVKGNGKYNFGFAKHKVNTEEGKLEYKYAFNNPQEINQKEYKEVNFTLKYSENDAYVIPTVSIRETDEKGITLDAFSCVKIPHACDTKTCEAWEKCKGQPGGGAICEPLSGKCGKDTDCKGDHLMCDTAAHACKLKEGRCLLPADCADGSGNKTCDSATRQCVDGNPCDTIKCTLKTIQTCDPKAAKCVLAENRCVTYEDCKDPQKAMCLTTPASGDATPAFTCVDTESSGNLLKNLSFEKWEKFKVPYQKNPDDPDGFFELPKYWYGLRLNSDGITLPTPHFATELRAEFIRKYDKAAHSGQYAMQIVNTVDKQPDRLTSLAIPLGGREGQALECGYWVRGKGSVKHRTISSAGLTPNTDFYDVDSLEWQHVSFKAQANTRNFRIVLYVSKTDAAKDHIQFDDFYCTSRSTPH